jgi:hypothetical protein
MPESEQNAFELQQPTSLCWTAKRNAFLKNVIMLLRSMFVSLTIMCQRDWFWGYIPIMAESMRSTTLVSHSAVAYTVSSLPARAVGGSLCWITRGSVPSSWSAKRMSCRLYPVDFLNFLFWNCRLPWKMYYPVHVTQYVKSISFIIASCIVQ